MNQRNIWGKTKHTQLHIKWNQASQTCPEILWTSQEEKGNQVAMEHLDFPKALGKVPPAGAFKETKQPYNQKWRSHRDK